MGKFSRVVAEVITRLNYHAATGRILDGFKINTDIQKFINGPMDFPGVTLFLSNYSEKKVGKLLELDIRVNLTVSVWNEGSAVDLAEAVEKVADALTTATDGSGRADLSLGGTAKTIMAFEYAGNSALATSLSTDLTMVIKAQASEYADRRN